MIVGPHTFNFDAITDDAVAVQAALRVQNASETMQQACHLLNDNALRKAMGQNALSFAQRQRGATERTMALLKPLLARPD